MVEIVVVSTVSSRGSDVGVLDGAGKGDGSDVNTDVTWGRGVCVVGSTCWGLRGRVRNAFRALTAIECRCKGNKLSRCTKVDAFGCVMALGMCAAYSVSARIEERRYRRATILTRDAQ